MLAAINEIHQDELPPVPEEAGIRLPKSRRKKQVLAILVERGQIRIKDLARALGLTHARAVQLANELESEGKLSRTREGLEVTQSGASEILGGSIKVLGPVEGGSDG